MKTRFAILYLGKEKQLFSVKESADKSLMVFQNVRQTTFGGEGLKDVKNQKISIHSKREHKGSLCNKIKVTYESGSNLKYDQSVIVSDKKKRGFLYPIANIMEATQLADDLNLKIKKGDQVVRLFGYIGAWETLCYTIYAHDNHVEMPKVQGFTKVTRAFSELSLTAYFTFFHLNDEPISLATYHIEGGVRLNEVLVDDGVDIVGRMSENGVERYIQRMQMRLANAMLDIKARAAAAAGRPFSAPAVLHHRWPQQTDDEHEGYGEYARRKSEIYQNPKRVDGSLKSPGEMIAERRRMEGERVHVWKRKPSADSMQ